MSRLAVQLEDLIITPPIAKKGGHGSGNFGHRGRPGEIGGSGTGIGRFVTATGGHNWLDWSQSAMDIITPTGQEFNVPKLNLAPAINALASAEILAGKYYHLKEHTIFKDEIEELEARVAAKLSKGLLDPGPNPTSLAIDTLIDTVSEGIQHGVEIATHIPEIVHHVAIATGLLGRQSPDEGGEF